MFISEEKYEETPFLGDYSVYVDVKKMPVEWTTVWRV
jgi:hypothetical protein